MSEKIKVPTLGESVTEATVSKWLKSQGDKVIADEPIVELETDKVNVEVPAPSNGILGSISVKVGETVNVGSLLGIINDNSVQKESTSKEIKDYKPPKKNIQKEPKLFNEDKSIPIGKTITNTKTQSPILKLEKESIQDNEEPLILEQVHTEKKIKKNIQDINKETTLSPAARKIAQEADIDLTKVEGTGKNGVILKEDLMSLMGTKPSPSERKIKHGPEERVKMTRLRLTIAKRLKEAQENAAMLTTFNEVDMSEVMLMRNQYKDEFQKNYSVKLGYMSFFVKACVIGLKNFPAVNAEIQGNEVVYKNYYSGTGATRN